ncbi:MAG TPA: hypothetical protein VH186_31445 [Chloroflexia bacterium]|nr:hypothetical protein [Chloroflexia bacterium]
MTTTTPNQKERVENIPILSGNFNHMGPASKADRAFITLIILILPTCFYKLLLSSYDANIVPVTFSGLEKAKAASWQ